MADGGRHESVEIREVPIHFIQSGKATKGGNVYQEKYQTALTVLFATEEINRSENLLPNITLGFHLFESFLNEGKTLDAYMKILSGWGFGTPNYRCGSQGHLVAVVGCASSVLSLLVANTFGMYGYPQISYGATDPLLSNKSLFPYFYRTVPNSVHLHDALNAVLKHFGWTWVGIVSSDIDNNESAIQRLKSSITIGGGCVEFTEKFRSYSNYLFTEHTRIAKVISDSSATIIIFWADLEFTYGLYLLLHELSRTKKVWIFLTDMEHLLMPTIDKLDLTPFHGNLAIQMKKMEIPKLMPFLQNITLDHYNFCNFIFCYKSIIYQCEIFNGVVLNDTCSHNTTKKMMLLGLETLLESYRVYNAIYSLAHAFQMFMVSKDWKELHREEASPSYPHPWKIHTFLKRVHFTNTAGEDIYFEEHGDAPPMYDLVNWVTKCKKKLISIQVGNVPSSSGEDLFVNTSSIVWPVHLAQTPPRSVCSDSCQEGFRRMVLQGKPACCYDCVPCPRGEVTTHTDMISCWKCPDDQWPNEKKDKCIRKQVTYLSYEELLGTTLASSAIVLSLASLFTLAIFTHYQKSPIVKATNRNLSFLLLLSLTFTFFSCLVFIGYPGPITCLLRQTIFGLSFTVSVSSLLAKTILVVLAFRATKPGSRLRGFMGQKLPCSIVGSCSSIQALICALWLGTCPPTPYFNLHSEPGQIVIECEEHLGFYVMLAYIAFLALGCSIIAFPARNLPDRYNEAKLITFSMVVLFSVWMTFTPVYLSTKGKYTVAVEVFAILVSAAGVLVCIFLPKCFIIFCITEKKKMTTRRCQSLSAKHASRRPF
ncbi:vomeronasal type-2 receptor 26-like [Dendropsophus ebraccatus]|uniref:vomeronasal type-2 receptor 26-like n=1 Tax=Dendropsophus ebraccatus TaxID=150705 RepID=UPI0038320FAD